MEAQIQTCKRGHDVSLDFENNTKKQKQEQSMNWQDLMQDILESILRRLSLRDLINFGLVCSSWQAMLCDAITNKQCHPVPQIPILLLCPDNKRSDMVPCFYEVNRERLVHPKGHLYPTSQFVLGTIDGWLIMVQGTDTNYHSLFFFNPVSSAKVMLPLQMNDHHDIPTIVRIVASSAPHNDCHVDSPFVAGLANRRILFCKMTSKSWNSIENRRVGKHSDIAIIGNLLYVMVKREIDGIEMYNLVDLDNSNENNAPKAKKLVVLDPKPPFNITRDFRMGRNRRYFYDVEELYLAHDEISGDVMLVVARFDVFVRRLNQSAPPITKIKGFRVLKPDRTSNDIDGIRWVEVEDLGDHVMFFDRRSCRLISTLGFQENVKTNCINFAVYKYRGARKPSKIVMGMFSLSDKTFHSFHGLDKSVLLNWAGCFWFTPKVC